MPAGSKAPRRRVLVLAESAHPEAQSVSWVGWAHSRALAERHDVHLLTRRANRDAILAAGLKEGRDFTAIDVDALERRILRLASPLRGDPNKGWTTLMALSLPLYYAFEALAWRAFADAIRGRAFDVVHRITPVSPTMPSAIAARCARAGVPFVLGPLNGGLPWPAQFPEFRRTEREWLAYLRGAHRMVPGYRASRRHASALIAGSRSTLRELPARYRDKSFYLPENGIDPSRFPRPLERAPGRALQVLFVGRLVRWKGCDLAIEAAAPFLRSGALRLEIVGDGPERAVLEALSHREGLADRVRFVGRVAPDRVKGHYAAGDILLFPSLREFGGGVVLEAMATGVVPVVVDYGGPGELVSRRSGVAVPMGDRAVIVAALRAALEGLVADPVRLSIMRREGVRRVERLFTWRSKADQISAIYEWVLGASDRRPDFGFDEPAGSAAAHAAADHAV